jgi:hypothetical protein
MGHSCQVMKVGLFGRVWETCQRNQWITKENFHCSMRNNCVSAQQISSAYCIGIHWLSSTTCFPTEKQIQKEISRLEFFLQNIGLLNAHCTVAATP